jgi:hypothetical protein
MPEQVSLERIREMEKASGLTMEGPCWCDPGISNYHNPPCEAARVYRSLVRELVNPPECDCYSRGSRITDPDAHVVGCPAKPFYAYLKAIAEIVKEQ